MKRAFTLVELALVLAILALLAHLAVKSLGEAQSQRRERLLEVQKSEIADAASAFLRDNGRLPRLLPSADGSGRLTLRELYERPDDLGEYDVRLSGDQRRVAVACGWKGPYIRLAPGKSTLRDPWGNEWASPDETGVDRLASVTNMFPAARLGTLAVSLSYVDEDGVESAADTSANSSSPVNVRWYAPCGSTVTGGVKTVERGFGGLIVFEDVPACTCAVTVDTLNFTGAVRRVDVSGGAGGALVEIKVR